MNWRAFAFLCALLGIACILAIASMGYWPSIIGMTR